MNSAHITPVVLTWNEAPNLRRCLERLGWAKRVVVLDSGSTDDTAAIAADFPNVNFLVRPFDDHTSQWNHAVGLCDTPWALSLDADYVLPHGFADELGALDPPQAADAYFARFRYCVFGKPLRATLYPPRAVLFRRDRCRYEDDGHTQRLHFAGAQDFLKSVIDHDDRKPLSRWFISQDKYATLEARKLLANPRSKLSLQDRLRLWILPAPVLTLFYCLFLKMLIFDGRRGLFYAGQRVLAEVMLSLRLLEKKLNADS